MLRLLATCHQVDVRSKGKGPLTLDVLKTPLRHAGVLDRRAEDLVSTIQRFANRAAHFQPSEGLRIDPKEAEITLAALDQLVPLFESKLPEALQSPPAEPSPAPDEAEPRDTWASWLAAPLFFVLGMLAMFYVAVPMLQIVLGDRPHTPPPHGVDLTQEELEALLAENDQAASPSPEPPTDGTDAVPLDEELPEVTPLRQAIAAVRLGEHIPNHALASLRCIDLQLTRNWIWAKHGYVFSSNEVQEIFAEEEDYQPNPELTRVIIERRLEQVDKATRSALNARMKDMGCACPGLRPRAPCPP
jgi:hypothetical protein